MSYLLTIERALWAAAKKHLPARAITGKALANAIRERSIVYTTERELLAERPRGRVDDDLAARTLFFSVADAPKIRVPVAELINRGKFPTGRTVRIADMGAGAGAMTLGLLSLRHPGDAIELVAVDRDERALQILRTAVGELPARWRDGVTVDTACSDVRKYTPSNPGFDLILAGTLLNEMTSDAAYQLLRRWLGWLSDDGAIIVIEPALRDTSRALHELRDRLVENDKAHVFAPCTHSVAPCPALANENDWCHEDRHVDLPERISQLVSSTGLRTGGLLFSYLVLRKQATRLADSDGQRAALRVVSRPRKLKGRLQCFVCGEHGRTVQRLLKRNRSADNRVFDSARRGDVLLTVPRADIQPDDVVELLRLATLD